ncbi:MAG: hypothetical protein VKN13_06700 [Cyanobacteriota bacterium]|nr:hypothetical protein [Cyanobacteriota bacterium]
MNAAAFRSLVQAHLLPLICGAQLVPGESPSPAARPAVVLRSRHSMDLKPSQASPWCLTRTRSQPFAAARESPITEKELAKAFVNGLRRCRQASKRGRMRGICWPGSAGGW